MLRRDFLRLAGMTSAVLLTPTGRALARPSKPGAAPSGPPPQTGFEQRDGASWTTHEEELEFLQAVDAAGSRTSIGTIGTTHNGMPIHLVGISARAPRGPGSARKVPTTLFICSQHGNEPAGRETGLQLIRDLAFTTDPVLLEQLEQQTILVIPSANPDGRAANTRGNGRGVDVNRDHLNLVEPESRAMAAVIRDWRPDLVLDLHEYGPSIPVLYDDEILYLWPRNLNADAAVRDLSRTLAEQYIKKGAEAAGYTADEYGLATVANQTIRVGDDNVNQTAGDEDEGICRNAMGLRHSLGILVESAVTMDPRNGPDEITGQAAVNRRRVGSQTQVVADTLRFMREQGDVAKFASDGAGPRASRSAAPVYFYGADNDEPRADEMQDPAPVRYDITREQAEELASVFALHGIQSTASGGLVSVPLAQPARPLVPLLLDERARRNAVDGTPVYA